MKVNDIKIGVVGAGSWGTALGNLLALKGYEIDHWVFETEVKNQIEKTRENKVFLPEIKLSENLHPTNDMEKAVKGKDLVLVVVPSHVMRITAEKMAEYISSDTILVSASKGIENKTHLIMTQVLLECIPSARENRVAALSGPSFAKDVSRQMATVITTAAKELSTASLVQQVFSTPYFRVYTNNDIIGVQIGGAVKNVIAIAAGILDGLGLGLNTRAALITRGLTEMSRLGVHLGADIRTFSGTAGLGDLVLTCTGNLSRNHTVGEKIGQGMKLDQILSKMKMVAEGVRTAKSVYNLSRKLGVDMPICHQIYHILYEDLDPKIALHNLMTRDLKNELD
ncbi:Glycerol-3-phosphate dehydrogenase (NAD(P)+) [Candidatus Magnetomoraceae bacterium gMMP-15]